MGSIVIYGKIDMDQSFDQFILSGPRFTRLYPSFVHVVHHRFLLQNKMECYFMIWIMESMLNMLYFFGEKKL